MSSEGERRRAAAIMTSITDGIIEVGKDCTVVYISGLPHALASPDWVGENFFDIASENFGSQHFRTLKNTLDGGESVEFCHEFRDLGLWYFIRGVAFDEGMIVSFRNITATKNADLALRRSRGMLSQILKILPVGVWVLNQNGTIVSANPEAVAIWGGARFVGTDAFGVYKGWRRDTGQAIDGHAWAPVRALATGAPVLDEEIDILSFDGKHKVIRSSALPLKDEDGAISGCVAVNQDITAQKAAETQLERALEAARRANRSKSRMVAALAHDLQQPLLGIRLHLNNLLAEVPPALAQTLTSLLSSVEAVERMATSLTEMAALEAGAVRPRPEEFDLCTLAESVFEQMAATADEKGLRITCRTPVAGPPALVCTDPLLLRRALGNLVSNAIRYTEQGGVLIAVRRRPYRYLVQVWDTGCGFDEKFLPHLLGDVFDPGAPAPKGSGIGLSTVAGLSRLLGIEISARSRIETGSVFSLSVPWPENAGAGDSAYQEELPAYVGNVVS